MGPKHSPTVGSWEGAVSYVRGTPVVQDLRVGGGGFRVQCERGIRFASKHCVSFRVSGPGFRVQGVGFSASDFGVRVQSSGIRVQGSGFRDPEFEFRVQGRGVRLRCRVYKSREYESRAHDNRPPDAP